MLNISDSGISNTDFTRSHWLLASSLLAVSSTWWSATLGAKVPLVSTWTTATRALLVVAASSNQAWSLLNLSILVLVTMSQWYIHWGVEWGLFSEVDSVFAKMVPPLCPTAFLMNETYIGMGGHLQPEQRVVLMNTLSKQTLCLLNVFLFIQCFFWYTNVTADHL